MDSRKKGDIVFNIDYCSWVFSNENGDDTIFRGKTKADNIAVSAANATVYAGAGNDFIGTSYTVNPTIYGGKGNDSIRIDVSEVYADERRRGYFHLKQRRRQRCYLRFRG